MIVRQSECVIFQADDSEFSVLLIVVSIASTRKKYENVFL